MHDLPCRTLLPGSCRRPAHISTSSGHCCAPISPGSHTAHLVLVGLYNRTTPGRSTPSTRSVHCSNSQDLATTMSFPRRRSMEHLVSLLLQGGPATALWRYT